MLERCFTRAFFIAVFLFVAVLSAGAEVVKSGNLYFNITSATTAELTYARAFSPYTSVPCPSSYEDDDYLYPEYVDVCYKGELEVPETIEHDGKLYTVTALGKSALFKCETVTKLTLPKTVISFGLDWATRVLALKEIVVDPQNAKFTSKDGILYTHANGVIDGIQYVPQGIEEILDLPSTITALPNAVFDSKYKLHTVVLPNTVKQVGTESLFNNCKSLRNVTLSNAIGSLPQKAFFNCSALEQIDLPASIKSIGESAFVGCDNLKKVLLHEGLQTIKMQAFMGCEALEEIDLPNTLESLGKMSFGYCKAIRQLHFGSKLSVIAEDAFDGALVPETITAASDCPLYNCSGGILYSKDYTRVVMMARKLDKNLVIPEGVMVLPDNMLFGHAEIESIDLPSTMFDVGLDAFWGVQNLAVITVAEGNPVYTVQDGGVLLSDGDCLFQVAPAYSGEVVVTAQIENINDYAFMYAKKYTGISVEDGNGSFFVDDDMLYFRYGEGSDASVILIVCPYYKNGIATVGGFATDMVEVCFAGCESLEALRFSGEIPPFFYLESLHSLPVKIPVYVPAAELDLYKEATDVNFINYVKPDSEMPQEEGTPTGVGPQKVENQNKSRLIVKDGRIYIHDNEKMYNLAGQKAALF